MAGPELADGHKQEATAWFTTLRDRICSAFERIEDEHAAASGAQAGRFERTAWNREGGGGGVMSIMRGCVFEKVGVNVSTVWGEFQPQFRGQIPGTETDGRFWASGISLVAHLCSPHVPPVHMNTRRIQTSKAWFGGGADLNPIFPDEADAAEFHGALERACAVYAPDAYDRFKRWADEYFFLPHRNEPRGIGGIFYDYLEGPHDHHMAFTRAVGEAFLDVYPRIVRRHMSRSWSEAERQHQLVRRGRYVEFNLLHDRGTQFGLKTGGNVEAVLMSLPPAAAWP